MKPQVVLVLCFFIFHASDCVSVRNRLGIDAPFKQIWMNQNVPGYPTLTAPILPPSISSNDDQNDVALFWSLIYQTDSQEQLSAVSLQDGKVLWTQKGINANISNQIWNLPYVGVGGFLSKSKTVVVNYLLTTATFIAQGYVFLDCLSGEVVQNYYTEPFADSWLVTLTGEDAAYYVKNGRKALTLFRLEGPDFDPSVPAANQTFSTNAQGFSSSPNLMIGQEHGVLLYALMNQSSQTYFLLDPIHLNVTWETPAISGSPMSTFIEPMENQIVLAQYSVDKPYVTSLEAFTIGSADPIAWKFFVEWNTPLYVPILFAGTVVSPDGRQTRACASYTIWTDATGRHSNATFFCFDVATQDVTFNTTLRVDQNIKATFMTVCKNWIIMLEKASGDLVALDGFAAEDPWANPVWRVPEQQNLVSLTWSPDYSYVIATYQNPTSLARWNVIN